MALEIYFQWLFCETHEEIVVFPNFSEFDFTNPIPFNLGDNFCTVKREIVKDFFNFFFFKIKRHHCARLEDMIRYILITQLD